MVSSIGPAEILAAGAALLGDRRRPSSAQRAAEDGSDGQNGEAIGRVHTQECGLPRRGLPERMIPGRREATHAMDTSPQINDSESPLDRVQLRFLVGPTGSGKSGLGVELARRAAGRGARVEIIALDSMTVYRGLDVGTAKPAASERGGITHHLVDVADPADRFDLQAYVTLVEETLAGMEERGAVPLFVGGTGSTSRRWSAGSSRGRPSTGRSGSDSRPRPRAAGSSSSVRGWRPSTPRPSPGSTRVTRGGPSAPSRSTSRPASLSPNISDSGRLSAADARARARFARGSRDSSSRPMSSTSGSASEPRRCSTGMARGGDGARRCRRDGSLRGAGPRLLDRGGAGERRDRAGGRAGRDRAPDAPVRPAPAHLVPQVRRRAGRPSGARGPRGARGALELGERARRASAVRTRASRCSRVRAMFRSAGSARRSRSSRRSAARRPRRRARRGGCGLVVHLRDGVSKPSMNSSGPPGSSVPRIESTGIGIGTPVIAQPMRKPST